MTLRFDADETAQARAAAGRRASSVGAPSSPTTSTSASCSAATARSSPRCAATPAPACRCSRSTSARSASSPRSTPTGSASDFDRAFARRVRDARSCRRSPSGARTATWTRDQRHLRPPQAGPARRRPRLRARRARRSAACAATGSWSPRRRARRATTSPTAGPVLAWGVEGYVVSFIAPHSLTARALVVAPDDLLTINNALAARSRSRSTSTAARRASCRRARTSTSSSRRAHGAARPAAGRELLPPPARAVRPARALSRARLRAESAQSARTRPDPSGPRW